MNTSDQNTIGNVSRESEHILDQKVVPRGLKCDFDVKRNKKIKKIQQ